MFYCVSIVLVKNKNVNKTLAIIVVEVHTRGRHNLKHILLCYLFSGLHYNKDP